MANEKFLKFNPLKLALAFATISAIIVFIITIFATYHIFGEFSFITSIIQDIYGNLGYSTTFLGALLGTVYSFITSFILTEIFAEFYNKLL